MFMGTVVVAVAEVVIAVVELSVSNAMVVGSNETSLSNETLSNASDISSSSDMSCLNDTSLNCGAWAVCVSVMAVLLTWLCVCVGAVVAVLVS